MTQHTPRPRRRSLLQTLALGASGVALGRTAGLVGARDAAAAAAQARRVVFVYVPNGTPQNQPQSQTWAAAGADGKSFTLGPMLTPVEPLRDQLVLYGNLCMGADRDSGDTHISGATMLLTGDAEKPIPNNFGAVSSGESLDLKLARLVGKQVTPKWPSLNLGIAIEKNGKCSVSYLPDGTKSLTQRDTWKTYQDLFGTLQTGTASPAAPGPDPAILHRLARRKSVLDSVAQDLTEFQKRLPMEDRARAEAQLAAIRTLETRLAAPMNGDAGGASTVACYKPEMGSPLNLDDGKSLPQHATVTFDLITAAFACDLTRVVSVVVQGAATSILGGSAFGDEADFHSLSHADYPVFAKAKAGVFSKVVNFAQALQKIPDGPGLTMLDTTLIVVTDENTNGHAHSNQPWWSLGGKAWGINVGNYLKLPNTGPYKNGYNGFTHARLLRTIGILMGAPDEPIGLSREATNPGVPGWLSS